LKAATLQGEAGSKVRRLFERARQATRREMGHYKGIDVNPPADASGGALARALFLHGVSPALSRSVPLGLGFMDCGTDEEEEEEEEALVYSMVPDPNSNPNPNPTLRRRWSIRWFVPGARRSGLTKGSYKRQRITEP